MLISEKNKRIDFNVIGYEFPHEKPSKREFNYDANWLNLKINYHDGKKDKIGTEIRRASREGIGDATFFGRETFV